VRRHYGGACDPARNPVIWEMHQVGPSQYPRQQHAFQAPPDGSEHRMRAQRRRAGKAAAPVHQQRQVHSGVRQAPQRFLEPPDIASDASLVMPQHPSVQRHRNHDGLGRSLDDCATSRAASPPTR